MTQFRLHGGVNQGVTTLNDYGLPLRMVFSGHFRGQTTLSDNFTIYLTGEVDGSSTLSAAVLNRIKHLYSTLQGQTLLGDSLARPIFGLTTLGGVLHVVEVQKTICPCRITGKVVRYGQPLTPLDLPLLLSEWGAPYSAFEVHYHYRQVRPDGSSFQVGSTHTPVMQKIGSYYASGIAGHGGQPGQWEICWSYRKAFGGALYQEKCLFQVVDSVSSPILGDNTCRALKYGWQD